MQDNANDTLNFDDMRSKPVGQEAKPVESQASKAANELIASAGQHYDSSLQTQSTASHQAPPPTNSPANTHPQQQPAAQPIAQQSMQTSETPVAAQAPISHLAAEPPMALAHNTQENYQPQAQPPEQAVQQQKMKRSVAVYTLLAKLAQKMRINRKLLNYIAVGGISILIFLVVFNFQVIWATAKYKFTKTKPVPAAQIQTTTEKLPEAAIVAPQPLVIIPKLNVNVPLQFPPTLDEKAIQVALRDGVVHYAGTAFPGSSGNVVIFGHSSNDWWQPGNYKFVFALLDKLAPGDTVEVHYESRKYVYQVTSSKVVAPTDFSVIQPTTEPNLTLITCTPPGTSWKRLVVSAKQIEPAIPVSRPAVAQGATTQPLTLPGDAPGFWTKLKNIFTNLF